MPDTWKAMKGKQKARITELMFKSVCEVYKKTGNMPSENQYEQLAREIFPKCNVKILQYEDLIATFIKNRQGLRKELKHMEYLNLSRRKLRKQKLKSLQ